MKTASWVQSLAAQLRLIARHQRLMLFVLVVIGILCISTEGLNIDNLVRHEATVRQWQIQHPYLSLLVGGIAYFTACFVPGTSGKAFVSGWLFGTWWGGILTNVASTLAALAAFYVARYLIKDWIRIRFGFLHKRIGPSIRHNGAAYLIGLRLFPMVPFSVVNPLMGVSNMSARTFWWSSQLGMLPGNFAFSYAGASLPN